MERGRTKHPTPIIAASNYIPLWPRLWCQILLSLCRLARSYCIMGDGCNMEGMQNEACSLAGHWGLGKLIALYDDNNISIDGHTEISFTEDVAKR